MTAAPVDFLLAIIDRAYDKKSWHGPNLRGSIRRVEARTAAWRPGAQRRNLWEIVVHCAYWKYTIRRRLLGEKRGSFGLKGSNWFTRPVVVSAEAWAADVALLDETHRSMRAAIAQLALADLRITPPGGKINNWEIIAGIAAHDVYHAGQIQLLKRLAARANG